VDWNRVLANPEVVNWATSGAAVVAGVLIWAVWWVVTDAADKAHERAEWAHERAMAAAGVAPPAARDDEADDDDEDDEDDEPRAVRLVGPVEVHVTVRHEVPPLGPDPRQSPFHYPYKATCRGDVVGDLLQAGFQTANEARARRSGVDGSAGGPEATGTAGESLPRPGDRPNANRSPLSEFQE
jgi:hypothetical protein